MHALKYLLLLCPLAWAQNSTSNNGTVIDGGNFLTDVELLSCWNYLNASQSNVTGSVYSYDYVTFAQHLAKPPGALDNIHKFSSLPVLVRRAFTQLACLCRRPLFGGNNSDLQCCVGSAAHIRVTPSPAFNLSQTNEAYIRTVCSVTTLVTDFASPAPSPISATPATATVMPTKMMPTTMMPTTMMPTNMTPSASVTSAPTMLSTTIAPTTMPTMLVSTMMPTASASITQTNTPTMSPTGTGGGGGGTVQPTSQVGPTAEPTLTPTKMPSPLPPTTNLDIYYVIFVAAGNTTQGQNATFITSYKLDLIRAMNILAQQVLTETTSSERRRSLRRLATQLQWPTTITNLANICKLQCREMKQQPEGYLISVCVMLTSELTVLFVLVSNHNT